MAFFSVAVMETSEVASHTHAVYDQLLLSAVGLWLSSHQQNAVAGGMSLMTTSQVFTRPQLPSDHGPRDSACSFREVHAAKNHGCPWGTWGQFPGNSQQETRAPSPTIQEGEFCQQPKWAWKQILPSQAFPWDLIAALGDPKQRINASCAQSPAHMNCGISMYSFKPVTSW